VASHSRSIRGLAEDPDRNRHHIFNGRRLHDSSADRTADDADTARA
jgi:hypothetical protein